MSEHFELTIESIAAGGDGVGRHEGMVVFVPRAAPGDRVVVRAERHGRLMRGRIVDLVEPSKQRVEPRCPHYVIDRCGGCQLQHLSYEAQIAAKSGIIRDALTRIGRLTLEKPAVAASSREWRYRRKLTLKLRRRGGRFIAGLHRYDTPDEVFDLRDCPITEEPVLQAWAAVLERPSLLPETRELRGAIRLLPAGFSFALEGGTAWRSHAGLFEQLESMLELWWRPEGQSRRLLHSRAGKDQAGASFTQVNPGVAGELRAYVVELASRYRPASVVDAYAGTGDVAAALADRGIAVRAIEIDRDAARVAARRLSPPSSVVAAAVEQALASALPADLVILNPPRAGLDARVPGVLAARSPGAPRALIYVSCNPATLARDLRRLDGYGIRSVRGFDMFPQTAHVETVCELGREI